MHDVMILCILLASSQYIMSYAYYARSLVRIAHKKNLYLVHAYYYLAIHSS